MAFPYRLTPRMIQSLESFLREYHKLFSGGRCSGWELEELIVKAIKTDTQANHHVKWREGGHDFKEDIWIRTNGEFHSIQIKAGSANKEHLIISGHRLGRFEGDFNKITDFLNSKKDNIISVPYNMTDDERGRLHHYKIAYIDVDIIQGIQKDKWLEQGRQYLQKNKRGVEFSLRPSMSWQIWWKIPLSSIDLKDLFVSRPK